MPGIRVELLFLFSSFPNEEELRWFPVGVMREEKAGEAVSVHSFLCTFYTA